MSQYYTRHELEAMGFASLGTDVALHRQSNVVFPERIKLGSHVRIDGFVTLLGSGSIEIGNYVHISPYCHLAGRGGIVFHDFSGLSSGVRIYTTSDDYSGAALTNPTVPEKYTNVTIRKVIIGKHVIVGSNSVILPGVEIGEGTAVGALTLVRKTLPPWSIYSGNPPSRLGERKRDLLALEKELLAETLEKAASSSNRSG